MIRKTDIHCDHEILSNTTQPIKRITKLLNGLQRVSGSFERIETVLNEKDATPEADSPIKLEL